MAAFTTALLLGLAAGGAFTAGKKLGSRNAVSSTTQASPSLMGPPPTAPAPALQAQSSAIGSALTASTRTRKRAAAGVINATTKPLATGAQTGVRSAFRMAVPRTTQPTYSLLGGTS